MKKLKVLAVIAAAAITLMACGGEEPKGGNSGKDNSQEVTVADESESDDESDDESAGKEEKESVNSTDSAENVASSESKTLRKSYTYNFEFYDEDSSVAEKAYITDYSGSFYSDNAEAQAFIEKYNCNIDDALTAVAFYNVNERTNLSGDAISLDDLKFYRRLDDVRGESAVYDENNFEPAIVKTDKYLADGTECYAVRMAMGDKSTICLLNIEADGKITYIGDDLISHFINLYVLKDDKHCGFSADMAQPLEYWTASESINDYVKNKDDVGLYEYVNSVLAKTNNPRIYLMAFYDPDEVEGHVNAFGDTYAEDVISARFDKSFDEIYEDNEGLKDIPVYTIYAQYDFGYFVPPYGYLRDKTYLRYEDLTSVDVQTYFDKFASKDVNDNDLAITVLGTSF